MTEHTISSPILSADGVPLKTSLARALRRQKLRALMLIAPLFIFVLLTFVTPIASMLFRSVENDIVAQTFPYTVAELESWNPKQSDLPSRDAFKAIYYDLFVAAEAKKHTRLGSRLNYEQTGISSIFRKSGRALDDLGKSFRNRLIEFDPLWKDAQTFHKIFSANGRTVANQAFADKQVTRLTNLEDQNFKKTLKFKLAKDVAEALPLASREYTYWAAYTELAKGRDFTHVNPWESITVALVDDLKNPSQSQAIAKLTGPHADLIKATAKEVTSWQPLDYVNILKDVNEDWEHPKVWKTIKLHSQEYTSGYFLNAIDMRKAIDGPTAQPENRQILVTLFQRTVKMSLIITISCILLGYPIAWLLSNLPMRTSNLLMILILLPFWTSLLVRTSAWKVMLQQQGVINEVLVWLGMIADDGRLQIINNQFGTIVAMTHILLPFMILPMYSVMQTIPVSYVRAAKSLGATNSVAFWRVYFPQSVPGIGAGSILVFILAIGYYITPEILGGTSGVFISNRIAYHISSSLNWGLAAALGTILLAVVLVLYWAYDKIVGIDNVKLG